jgi:hypothetical protein
MYSVLYSPSPFRCVLYRRDFRSRWRARLSVWLYETFGTEYSRTLSGPASEIDRYLDAREFARAALAKAVPS